MLSPRWQKLARDVWTERGRVLIMVAAISVSLIAIGVIVGTRSILTREIEASYARTRPATATLEIPSGVDASLSDEVRQRSDVSLAEPRSIVVARLRVGEDWRRALLFVVDDFANLRLNLFRPESGAWPPPDGTMLLERASMSMLQATQGQPVLVKTPNGRAREVVVSGVVHDPGLAPSWMERTGYGYVSRATLRLLGEAPVMDELRVELKGRPVDVSAVMARAAELAKWVSARGHPVQQIRVPPPALHPHQKQMSTVLLMLLTFAGMALVLSAILVASSLTAMLARQVREIGVMKTIGATSGQIARLYAVLVASVGLASVAISLPPTVLLARGFAAKMAEMLNIEISDRSIPVWVFGVQTLAGVLVPLIVTSVPILRASRTTVRQTIDDHGVNNARAMASFAFLPVALRNAFRRPARLALTVGLLSAGGMMLMTALNVKRGWEANVAKVYETRSYDVEVLLQTPESTELANRIRELPGVREVESWGISPAAFSKAGRIDVVHTYPDRAHGSLWVMAPPPATKLMHLPVKAGRWLIDADGDSNSVVLNHSALAQVPGLAVGDSVTLSLEGPAAAYRVVGVVEDIGSPAAMYMADRAFARATNTTGQARMFRVATTARTLEERRQRIESMDRALMASGVSVEGVVPLSEIRTAVGDHVIVLIRMLVAMAAILGIVGALGLGSAMSVSVLERTREIAVMKTLGATPQRLMRMLIHEGVSVGMLSWVLAVILSVPLSFFVARLVGTLGFLAPLPLVLSGTAPLIWLAVLALVSFIATVLPARRASRMSVLQGLAQT